MVFVINHAMRKFTPDYCANNTNYTHARLVQVFRCI